MAIKSYVNGAGGSTGADLAILDNTYQSGNYYYVGNAVTGASDSNAGTERTKPLLTLSQAHTNASAGDTIVLLASHAETISSAITLNKAGLSIVGEGSGSSLPRLTCGGAVAMLDVTAAGVLVDNVRFPASTAAPTARIRIAAAGSILQNLVFDCGASDTTRSVSYITGASDARLTGSTFTATAATPAVAVEVINALAGLTMDEVTFDGGSFPWSDYAFKGTAAVTRLRATNIYQRIGSHILLPTGSTGVVQISDATGDSRLDWAV